MRTLSLLLAAALLLPTFGLAAGALRVSPGINHAISGHLTAANLANPGALSSQLVRDVETTRAALGPDPAAASPEARAAAAEAEMVAAMFQYAAQSSEGRVALSRS